MRTDRNIYSKNLVEAQDEITDLQRKFKTLNHQVEQLKEEIDTKDGILVKEHLEISRREKERDVLALQISKVTALADASQQMVKNQQTEEENLRRIITVADTKLLSQQKSYESVIQERDMLGTQLIHRNDELGLLYEKIRIQTSTLGKGELQYAERIEDVRVLRLEIKRLRRQSAILQNETMNTSDLRVQIFKLQRDILRERTRVKVLEEELESPMNIHRWRKLSVSDPTTYELILKVQSLQKRLIKKTEDVVEKEMMIEGKEKLYNDIKLVLQRQPGPEIFEELQTVRTTIKNKTREGKVN